jgi:hypothetical protein
MSTVLDYIAGTNSLSVTENGATKNVGGTNIDNAFTAPQTFNGGINTSAISISGTVTQAPGAGTNNQGPALQTADAFDDWVPAGLLGSVPSPASLTCDLPAGVAVVLGQRTVLQVAAANTYPTSSDTYVDFSYNGLLTYSSVANGATAPSVAADSLRLEKVVTSPIVSNAPSLAASTAAGTLVAGTYEYQRVAYDATGYGLPSALISITTTATGEVVLTWADEPNEVSSDLYGRISGSIGLLASGVTGTTWTDDGSATVGAAPPTAATSNAVQAVTQLAQVGASLLMQNYPGNNSNPIVIELANAPIGTSVLSNQYADAPLPSYDNSPGILINARLSGNDLYQRVFLSPNNFQEVSREYVNGAWTTWVDNKVPLRFQDTSTTVNEITIPYSILGSSKELYYGQKISVLVANTNTGPVTLNGAPVYSASLTPLQGGELLRPGYNISFDFVLIGGPISNGWLLVPSGGGASLPVMKAQASGQAVNLGQADSLYQLSALALDSTTTAGGITATAAQLVGGYLADGATQTAAFTVTTDTAVNILAAMPNAVVGTAFKWRFANNDQSATGYAGTLAGGTGVTIGTVLPNPAVAKGQWADFILTFTSIGSSPALTAQYVGRGEI